MSKRRFLPVVLVLVGAAMVAAIAFLSHRQGLDSLFEIGGKRSMLAMGGLALAMGGIVTLLPGAARRIGQWTLLAAAALAVVLAADLLNPESPDNLSLTETGIKVLMVILVGVALRLSGLSAPSSADRSGALALLRTAVQTGLLVLLMHQYHIESLLVYHNIMLLAFYGFLLHHLLAPDYRLPFFLLLSLACILCVFGAVNGAWLIGIGLLLIGICHLPLPYLARVGLLLLAGAALVVLRVDRFVHAPWSSAIWPILGSMFMFRLIIYIYDLKHQKEPVNVSRSLSYFFLFPNVAFPLFPVVDYSAFRRTYYDQEPNRIYRTGIAWMYLGVLHLLCYRLVNYHLMIAPTDVNSIPELTRYLIANFLLYLRLSGQFHLIVGMLHLFGFNLPVTHHLYYLSSSFTDFWRRINIYWKDFMLKVFYMPTYFRLRKRGPNVALVISTLIVFLLTWLFHGYQWFWLRGTFLLSTTDMLFWATLAVLVLVNSMWETNRGRERALGQRAWSFGEWLPMAIRTVGTFGFICVLWSLWSSASLSEWFALWAAAGLRMDGAGMLIPLALLGLVMLGETLRIRRTVAAITTAAPAPAAPRLSLSGAISVGVVILLLVIGNPRVYGRLPDKQRDTIHDLTVARLSTRDAALLQRGYYEDLIGVDRFNSELWELYSKRPAEWRPMAAVLPDTGDFLRYEFKPDTWLTFKNHSLRTNRWGMRDQNYDKKKPAKTYRIAMLGSSHVMGSGVGDGEPFEAVLEERLNREMRGGRYSKVEILNFAMGSYSPIQQLVVLEKKACAFKPDAVFFIAHADDPDRTVLHLVERHQKGVPNPIGFAQEIERKAGIVKDTPEPDARQLLMPYRNDLTARIYRQIAEKCRKEGILPVWVFLPTLEDTTDAASSGLLALARQADFTILDLSGLYANKEKESLIVAAWDWHPNAQGHRLIADRLYRALQQHSDAIPLGLAQTAQNPQ